MGFCSTHILNGWNLRSFRKIAHTDSRLFINSHACLLAEPLGLRMSASLAVFRCSHSFIEAKMLFLNNTSCRSRVWTHLKIVLRPGPHHGVQGWNECENNAKAFQLTRHDAQMRHIGCSSVYCSMSTKMTLYMKLSNLDLPFPVTRIRMCLYWQFQNCLVPGGHPILLYWVYDINRIEV